MNQTKTLYLKDRQILFDIGSNKKYSYPVANSGDIVQGSNVFGPLNMVGVEAWNNGEQIDWTHLEVICDIRILDKVNFN